MRADASPDAIAWHENDLAPRPDQFAAGATVEQPDGIEADVATLRRLVAARPTLGHPAILINEYGDPQLSAAPGWDVGRLAALEAAGVTEANRSCFNTCGDGSLDGLLAGDGSTPLAGYWVYASYASLSGRRIPVTTTFGDVTGLGTRDADGTVQVLIGRHQGCGVSGGPSGPACAPAAVPVTVRLETASAAATVTEATIPMTPAPLPAPVSGPAQPVAVHGGTVSVATPSLDDGDAVLITIRPT